MKRINSLFSFKKHNGLSLIEAVITLTVTAIAVVGMMQASIMFLTQAAEAKTANLGMNAAEIEISKINILAYDDIGSVPRAQADPLNKLDREIAVIDNGNNTKTVKVRIYQTGSDTPIYTIEQLKSMVAPPTPHGSQVFTNSGSWTVPAGVSTITVTVIGGGGGGAGAKAGAAGGRGANGMVRVDW